MRLPHDPCRALGGRKTRKKDKRVSRWEEQINPGKKHPRIVGHTSYKKIAVRKLKQGLTKREIVSPELRELIADRFRK